jgi:hypothetical protein
MLPVLPIAATNFNVLFGIIAAIVWVIMQLANKSSPRRPPQRPPPADSAPTQPTSTQAELRRFLEDLTTTEPAEIQEQAPPPPPRRDRPAARPKAFPKHAAPPALARSAPMRTAPRPPPVPVAAPPRQPEPVYVPEAPGMSAAKVEMQGMAVSAAETAAMALRKELADQFRKNTSLRQFMVTSELLAPPLALRQGPWIRQPQI